MIALCKNVNMSDLIERKQSFEYLNLRYENKITIFFFSDVSTNYVTNIKIYLLHNCVRQLPTLKNVTESLERDSLGTISVNK